MTKPLRLGIAGLGTVGVGVVQILRKQAALLEARTGRAVVISAVSARSKTKDRGVNAGYCDASSSGVIVRSSAGNWVQAPKRVKAVAKAVEENARFMQHGVHQQGAFLQVSW